MRGGGGRAGVVHGGQGEHGEVIRAVHYGCRCPHTLSHALTVSDNIKVSQHGYSTSVKIHI